jgi:hypothetical protein
MRPRMRQNSQAGVAYDQKLPPSISIGKSRLGFHDSATHISRHTQPCFILDTNRSELDSLYVRYRPSHRGPRSGIILHVPEGCVDLHMQAGPRL